MATLYSLQKFHQLPAKFAGVIVDIRTTNKLPVTPFVAYVGLSCSRGRETSEIIA